jgi:hypothetical protein
MPRAGDVVLSSEGGTELAWKVEQPLPNGTGLLVRRGDEAAMVDASDLRPAR